MLIEREFATGKVTLAFETGNRIKLTKEESREFYKRMEEIKQSMWNKE